jgi:hypothetical protein
VENRHAELGSRPGPATDRKAPRDRLGSHRADRACPGEPAADRDGDGPGKALGDHDASAGIIVLDDVTPRHAKASAALKACDAGLGAALDLLLDSETAARCLN